jgi:hypothetical protein
MGPQISSAWTRQRMMRLIGAVIVFVLTALIFWWYLRYLPEKRAVNRFFEAIENQDFDSAYGVYHADPGWKQHPDRHNNTFNQFVLDWGPVGDYGVITSHSIECATDLPTKEGVIVVVRVNNRGDRTESLLVEKKSKVIGPSPNQVTCR